MDHSAHRQTSSVPLLSTSFHYACASIRRRTLLPDISLYHIADQYNLVFLETTRMLNVFIFRRERNKFRIINQISLAIHC